MIDRQVAKQLASQRSIYLYSTIQLSVIYQIYLFTYVCMYICIYLPINIYHQYVSISINLSIYPSSYVSIYLTTPITKSINIYHLSVYIPTHLPTYHLLLTVFSMWMQARFSSPQPLLRYPFHFHAPDPSRKIPRSVGSPAWRHRRGLPNAVHNMHLLSLLTLKCLPPGTAVWNESSTHPTQSFLPKASRTWLCQTQGQIASTQSIYIFLQNIAQD